MKRIIPGLKRNNNIQFKKNTPEIHENKKEIIKFKKALNEFKNGETVQIEEYLRKRKINV
jgi:hypothetical protein